MSKTLTARPDTREQDAAQVLLGALPDLDGDLKPGARLLVIDDPTGLVEDTLTVRGLKVTPWRRRASGRRAGSPWPAPGSAGPYDGATLRLPHGKEALDLALHAAAANLAPGAPLWVYGANDEGIKSAKGRLSPLFGEVETLDTRRHCRVEQVRRPAVVPGLKTSLAELRQVVPVEVAGAPFDLVSYPGLFAKGQLDPGTALLLANLPPLTGSEAVLDFGCGPGLISAWLRRLYPDLALTMLDADAVAIEAARENVPGARHLCGDGWEPIQGQKQYDVIVSNPPIHAGKARSYDVLSRLIDESPSRLKADGRLILVVQRQVPVDPKLQERFAHVRLLAEDGRYRVWLAGKSLTGRQRAQRREERDKEKDGIDWEWTIS